MITPRNLFPLIFYFLHRLVSVPLSKKPFWLSRELSLKIMPFQKLELIRFARISTLIYSYLYLPTLIGIVSNNLLLSAVAWPSIVAELVQIHLRSIGNIFFFVDKTRLRYNRRKCQFLSSSRHLIYSLTTSHVTIYFYRNGCRLHKASVPPAR